MMNANRQPQGVVLRLGDFETTLLAGQTSSTLAIGSRRTADDWFAQGRDTPTPLELENAIMAVEDAIAHVALRGENATPLLGDDAALVELARFAGVDGPPPLRVARSAVENAFERLAMVAQGRPWASSGLPGGEAGRVFAATLLIVRELMHHLAFAELVVDA